MLHIYTEIFRGNGVAELMQSHTDKKQEDDDYAVNCAGQHIAGVATVEKRSIEENQDKGPVDLDIDAPDSGDLQ